MKTSLSLLLLVFSSPAFSATCPSLAGEYRWQDELDNSAFINLTVSQSGCVSLDEIHDQGWGFTVKHPHVLDGAKRLVEDDGDFQAYETATLDSSGLHIMEERHSVDSDTGENILYYVSIEFTQPKPEQLVMKRVLYREDMAPESQDKTIFTRKTH